jgi:flavodoxin I
MKTLVVYESFFGNTEKIALAIGKALGLADADVIKVGNVKPDQLNGLELLIVGSPTRAFQPCPETKAFLRSLQSGALKGIKVAAFDTRVAIGPKTPGFLKLMIKLFGYAAEPIARRLVRKGGTQVLQPAGFLVVESEGPLQDGELERAAEWVKGIQ